MKSPYVHISYVEGYNYRGPFPKGQLVQFVNSPRGTLSHFYSFCDNYNSHPEDIVNLGNSPDCLIEYGLIDGCNSPSGVAVIIETGSSNARVQFVDAVNQGNGCFATYAAGTIWETCRAF